MERSRAASLRFFQRLPERAILKPRTQGKWSVKDTFAHIVAWEEEGARRLELIRCGRGDRIRFYDDMAEAHRFNARVVRQAWRWSWAELLRRAGRVRASLVRALLRVRAPVAACGDDWGDCGLTAHGGATGTAMPAAGAAEQ